MHAAKPKPVQSLITSPSLRITVLAPHPDDFDAIGVTLRKLNENGNPIHLAVLSSCSGVEDAFCSPPTLEVKSRTRQQEQRDSCQYFGLPAGVLEFPSLQLDSEGQPALTAANTEMLRIILQDSGADIVFLPHGHDSNAGHRQTWAMFRRAAAQLGRPLTAFYNHDPKTIALRVDAFTGFGESLASWKGELLRFHRSQQHRNLLRRGYGLDTRILDANGAMAKQLGLEEAFAEAFELERFPQTPHCQTASEAAPQT
jgi:LmbE family N-acetylglucosaminyl deacetylase